MRPPGRLPFPRFRRLNHENPLWALAWSSRSNLPSAISAPPACSTVLPRFITKPFQSPPHADHDCVPEAGSDPPPLFSIFFLTWPDGECALPSTRLYPPAAADASSAAGHCPETPGDDHRHARALLSRERRRRSYPAWLICIPPEDAC